MAKKPAENVVLIGRKPVMNYVVACLTFFNAGGNEVVVKARGRAISTAVDTVELLRRAFVKDLGLKNIEIGTEEMIREGGQKSNVSTIEITVGKGKS
ncbi:MAG: DNA-binding protein Alba [Candidatus Bathyarchaeota archaeon]|nr:DNA-binding protein Alba [Candidatus Bathyarchaeota archaeon]MDH5532374.1 DNA-binding protein Alba [Candidatus Bathyarchaeota archaeon]MDH5713396.1 DNA-binding protein Alba [Candidatus Bathyarchaeota archaeon]